MKVVDASLAVKWLVPEDDSHHALPAAYDAHYVALAASLKCELWTADERLLNQLSGRFTNVRVLREFRPN